MPRPRRPTSRRTTRSCSYFASHIPTRESRDRGRPRRGSTRMSAGRRRIAAGRRLRTAQQRGDRHDGDHGRSAQPCADATASTARWRRCAGATPALTNGIRAYVAKGKTLTSLAVAASVRGQSKAWVASDYRTLPASTVGFDQRFMPVMGGPRLSAQGPRRLRDPAGADSRPTHDTARRKVDRIRSARSRNVGRHHERRWCCSREQRACALTRPPAGAGRACRAARARARRRTPSSSSSCPSVTAPMTARLRSSSVEIVSSIVSAASR